MDTTKVLPKHLRYGTALFTVVSFVSKGENTERKLIVIGAPAIDFGC